MKIDPSTTKYVITASISADGIVEKPDVVGAIFGQTEGLLGDELDLRELQKSGRMGRIEVEIASKKGKSDGKVILPSSLDQVETAILASALETIDRVGPCKAKINITNIEDIRAAKKQMIVERAKQLLNELMEKSKTGGLILTDSVRQAVQIEEIVSYGKDKCPAGPNVESSDGIIVVEGRSDVLNLLKYGIKNAIAVEGTNVPPTVADLSREKVVTVFVDGDRGGELIIKEMLQKGEVDFVARAPQSTEVEELSLKQIMKSLRAKMPSEQYISVFGLSSDTQDDKKGGKSGKDKGGKGGKDKGKGKDHGGGKKDKGKDKPKGKANDKVLPKDMSRYKEVLGSLTGTLKASLLDKDGNVAKEVDVRNLIDTLQNPPENITAVVFDGVITQRILDMAQEKNIGNVIGVRKGSINKQPTEVTVLTKDSLN